MIKSAFARTMHILRQYTMIFKLLLIYVAAIPVMKTPDLPLLAQRIQFSDLVFLFLFFSWLKVLIKNKRLPQDPGLNKPFLLFMFFCLLSFFNSTNLFTSTIEILGLIYLYVMLILVVDIVDNKKKLDAIVKVWIGALVVVLALGFIGLCISMVTGKGNIFCLAYHGNFPYLKDKTIYRVWSVFRHPLGLASYLVVSLGLVASELLLAENRKYKVFLKFLIFFIFLAIITTISRDIAAFMFSFLLIYSYFHKIKNLKFRFIKFLLIFLIISIFLGFFMFDFLFHIISYKAENSSKGTHRELVIDIHYTYAARLAQKIAALEMIKRHPFLGIGLAMYPSYLQKLNEENYFKDLAPIYCYVDAYRYGSQYLNFYPPTDPHNDTLQYLAETGIFGGGAFILFIITFLYLIFVNLNNIKADNQYLDVRLFCFFASFVGVLIESMALDIFKTRHLWFLMAMILALIAMYKDKVSKIRES